MSGGAPTDGDEAARLAVAVGRINRLIRTSGDSLPYGMVSALSAILRRGPLRPSDLARIEAVSPPTMTRIVGDLEARGLVARASDPSDGRSFTVAATDAGRDAVLAARLERAGRIGRLLDRLDAGQRQAVVDALPALEELAESG